ncbi:sel1 repeat family protein, partial [Verrucomicrobia bacterium]|nr:sel1 repeat family protein [Verrucomicrobiota bacterium]
GKAYYYGNGVMKDYKKAVPWLTKAAEQGCAPAQWSLGVAFQDGNGVMKDYVSAHAWYNLASANGEELGSKYRESVSEKMSSDQVAQAQRLAKEWFDEYKAK